MLKGFDNIWESPVSHLRVPQSAPSTNSILIQVYLSTLKSTFTFAACKWTELQNKECDIKDQRGSSEASELSSQKW